MDRHNSGLDAAASRQMIVWDDESLVKSQNYRCSFCKRGFSNAQALGGHMNIHRKDRAKLKEFSCEHSLSLDATRTCPDCHEDGSPSKENLISSESDRVVGKDRKENDLIDCLPLFGDESNHEGDHKQEEKRKEIMRYGELDLELRLGLEPHHDAKSNP